MTNQTEPIRKSSLPTTPPPEWEFFTFFPYPDDDGGDMVRGQRQRGVQVRRQVTYGDWEPVRPDRWADEPEAAAVSAAVAPPANRAAAEAALAAVEAALCDTLLPDAREEALARLMKVLPPTTDRAAVLREAADVAESLRQFERATGARWAAQVSENVGILRVADELRRMADETATETPTVTVHAAPDLSPTAEEALGALIDVAKQQAVCDFEHPHPEHPCGRRTAAGARQDGAES